MGRLAEKFPRFPHTCVIYTMQEPTGFESEEEIAALKKVVWEGICRKESNTSIRTFKGSENVIKGDYRVQLGEVAGGRTCNCCGNAVQGVSGKEQDAVVTGITSGMFVDVVDRSGSYTLNINDVYAGNLGTTLYCDEYKT